MQSSPPPIRLHWFPVRPVWIVSAALIILAALPHQLPIPVSYGLQTTAGAILFAAASAAVAWKEPVLGAAMFMLLATTYTRSYVEGFSLNITQDHVDTKKRRWEGEKALNEKLDIIQTKTQSSMTREHVTPDDAGQWYGEESLGENTVEFQSLSDPDVAYQETTMNPDLR